MMKYISIVMISLMVFTGCATADTPPSPAPVPCPDSTNSYIRWADKKVTVEEVEKENMVSDERLGPDPVPFGFINDDWEALKSKMQKGDELWHFSSPPETWKHLAGRAGYVLIRDCEVIAVIVNLMN